MKMDHTVGLVYYFLKAHKFESIFKDWFAVYEVKRKVKEKNLLADISMF